MTREMEFRIWNKKESQMINPEEIIEIAIEKGEIIGISFLISDEEEGELIGITDDFVIMSYIDWNDQFGKKIYVGDIVKFRAECNSMKEHIGVIIKDDALNYYYIDVPELDLFTLYQFKRITVLGNIYENPELIK